MRPFALALAGLLGIGILTYLCANHHGPHFAADLSAKTAAALKAASIAPVQVEGEGQIITLRGEVATEQIKANAGEAARLIPGVEEVRNLLTVAPPGPPPLTATQRVEAVNCQKEFTTLLSADKIRFQTAKADINPASHRLLDRLVAVAGKCPAARIQVEGHTDSQGARDMNLRLSRARAEAVVAYLKGKGIAAARLTSEGFGPDQPVGNNKTPAGREKNRRTEFKVQGI
jgi:OmpA-OmpF porin, OOP family